MPALRSFSRLAALAALGAPFIAGSSLATAAPPTVGAHSISITASPATVTFGSSGRVSGTFSGAETTGQKVTLESSDFPFTAGYSHAQTTTTSNTDGSYSFTVGPGLATKYRVTGKTPHSQETTSAAVMVQVRYKITLHVSDRTPKSGQRVRFSGLVYPAHDGRKVAIQRKTSAGTWKTVSRPALVSSGGSPPSSAYKTSLRVRRTGRYRAVIGSDADHVRNQTGARLLRVHG